MTLKKVDETEVRNIMRDAIIARSQSLPSHRNKLLKIYEEEAYRYLQSSKRNDLTGWSNSIFYLKGAAFTLLILASLQMVLTNGQALSNGGQPLLGLSAMLLSATVIIRALRPIEREFGYWKLEKASTRLLDTGFSWKFYKAKHT